MPIKVSCPKCGGVLHAPDDAGGKRGRCPTCGTVLNIPADAPKAAVGAAPADHPFQPLAPSPAGAGSAEKPTGRRSPGPDAGGTFGFADVADPPRGAAAGHIPAPAFSPGEPRKVPEPITRSTFMAGPDDEPVDAAARGWKRVRRGLGWVRGGVWLLMLAVVAPAAVAVVADKVPGAIPDKDPGFLGAPNLTSVDEITLGAGLVPAVLGLLAVLVGRAGIARAPRTSFGRGLARLAVLGTLVAVAGLVAAAVPAGLLISQGVRPDGLADRTTHEGMLQRFGLAAAVGFGVAAELWFVTALGRFGASLHHGAAAARSGRLLALAGLAIVAGVVAYVAGTEYASEVNNWWADNVKPKWDQLGRDQLTARAGVVVLVAVLAGVLYLRLTGAARRAAREWLVQHHRA